MGSLPNERLFAMCLVAAVVALVAHQHVQWLTDVNRLVIAIAGLAVLMFVHGVLETLEG